MALRKCEKCGVFFGTAKEEIKLCKNCRMPNKSKSVRTGDMEYDRYINCRNIVYDNPMISPEELVDRVRELGIDIELEHVIQYIIEGKLTLETGVVGNYCLKCGRIIDNGTLCSPCEMKMKLEKIEFKEEQQHRGMFTRS